ncbi:MAG: thioredoxin family protein [Bacteroidetes bacterium]|nr:thioredoxin family protein [Bacteroidota bacterium]MCL5739174.1 thioredoxin family protein [Bacteroidota bacterium]
MLFLVYILLGIFIAFMGMQYLMILRSKKNKGKRVEQVSGKLGKMMLRGQKAMVYFYSPTCRACKVQTPIIDRLISDGHEIQKVDISRDISTARKFGVMATPTTVVLEGDKIVEFLVGAKTEEKLRRYF